MPSAAALPSSLRRSGGALRRVALATGRGAGLLLLVAIVAAGAAAVVHQTRLPTLGYTWSFPLRILRMVVLRAHFPSVLLGALALGWCARPDGRARLQGVLQGAPSRTLLLRAAVGGALALALGALATDLYTPLDQGAVFLLGGALGVLRPRREQVAEGLGHLLLAFVVFNLVSYAFTVFKAQLFTLREPVDAGLVALEQALLGTNPHRAVARAFAADPRLAWLGDRVYFYLFDHMLLVSALLAGMGLSRERGEFVAALCVCYVIGGVSYFVVPGLGPMYAEPQTYAYLRGSGLETARVGAALYANTRDLVQGRAVTLQTYSYIACMPSLHMAHELVMAYYSRRSRPALVLSLLFTLATFVATLGLGWHYAIDLVGSVVLTVAALALVRAARGWLMPAALQGLGDPALQAAPR